jgi:molybdopterin molybdotransferase
MAQLSDDCFAFGGRLLPVDEAIALLVETTRPLGDVETVPLYRAAGRVLADAVVAEHAVPPHDNSAVDGYAVHFDDLAANGETRLPVGGRAAAGHPLGRAARRGEAIRIFTGAPMPPGPDTVMMQEDCRIEETAAGTTVVIPPGIRRGANRRKAGEDVAAGATVLPAGRRLRPQDVGLAASLGHTGLRVAQRPRVALFSTGDELVEPGRPLAAGRIYDSNRYVLHGLLSGLDCAVTDLGILADRFQAIRDALAEAARGHDLIVTSGGMSTGEEDHVKAAVEALGKLAFWRLAIKPGRPVAMGEVMGTSFVGLPGNPVAVMVTFLGIVRPLVFRLMGATPAQPQRFRVRADFAHRKKEGRREWLRARLVREPEGTLAAVKFPRDGAGILSSMAESDGLVELPEDMIRLEPGTMVDYLPFSEVFA